ncbi:MAG: M48 family metalloprotease [Armatimonadetes bacterium]|nr:M48 family metalloprotease [Armatimonadota bacterium]
MTRAKFIFSMAMRAALLLALCGGVCATESQKEEERLGYEYAKDVEAHCKLTDRKDLCDRVEKVGATLAQIANQNETPASYGTSKVYQFKYHFKVVEDKDVNAFALPGGYVYVNTGLLEIAETDDELAGVLAHEIAHVAHHHTVRLLKEQSKVNRYIALVALMGIIGKARGRDLNNLFMGAQLVNVGKVNGYSVQAEKDADRTAVAYMLKSSYHPEGLLSFMKKLDAKHDESPTLPLGIFQTHPAPFRRVIAICKAMQDSGVKLDMRKMRDIAYAKAVPVKEKSDQYKVEISKHVVFVPADLGPGKSSKERAEQTAREINGLLDAGLTAKDLTEDAPRACLIAKGTEIIKIDSADVKLNGSTERALLDRARSALTRAVWADWLSNTCEVSEELSAQDLN